MQLRVAEQYLHEFGNLAKESTTMILPATISDVASMIALAMNVVNNSHSVSLRQAAPASNDHVQ